MSLLTGIVAYWKFNEGSGTTAHDSTSGGNDLALNNSPPWGTIGPLGGGLTYNGTSQFCSIAAVPSDLNLSTMSWAGWIINQTGGMLFATFAGNAAGYEWNLLSGQVSVAYYAGGALRGWYGAGSAVSATATHVVATLDMSAGVLSVYLNGVLSGTATGLVTGTIPAETHEFDVGARAQVSSRGYFGGSTSNFGIWNRLLTSTEAPQLYNGGAGLQYPFSVATESLFRQNNLTGMGSGGPFFQNPLTRSMLGWRKALSGLLIPDRKLVLA